MNEFIINSSATKESVMQILGDMYGEHKYLTIKVETGRQRTTKQNSSLHVYLRMLAKALNDAGLDMRRTLKTDVEIPWGEKSAKEYLWRPIQKVITNHESTIDPERAEYMEIYETLNRMTASKFGISIPWPHKDED